LAVWEAMYRLEPWGDDWVQAARIEAAIINKDNPEPVNPYDLIPNEDNRPAEEEDDAAALNARVRSWLGV
jgi:hypothetical protein